MNILFWGLTFGVIGKIFIAIGILRVHFVMAKEQKIDAVVIRSFAVEKTLTFVGIAFLILGYVMELYFYSPTPMLTCDGVECTQASAAILSQ